MNDFQRFHAGQVLCKIFRKHKYQLSSFLYVQETKTNTETDSLLMNAKIAKTFMR